MNNLKITIKKNGNVFVAKRSEFISCDESADGIVFKMKGGLLLHYTDNKMEGSIKMKIKLTIDNMNYGNILVDLDDMKNPVQFFAPENNLE